MNRKTVNLKAKSINADKRTFKNNWESLDHVTSGQIPPSLYRNITSTWRKKTKTSIESKSVNLPVFQKQVSVLG